MKLNKIYIKNFGIYKGNYEYDFTVTEDKNVILVSGKNGSGKTTLLNVAKLSIYGPKLFGFPTTKNKEYLAYIQSNLNAFAKHEGSDNFEIGIDFTMFYEDKLKMFTILRRWDPSNNLLKETTYVYIDGALANEVDTAIMLDYIHRNVPKTLFELFFFDGEKINDMFMLKSDLNDMLNHVYNLNLFLGLKQHLKQYKTQVNVTKQLSEYELQEEKCKSNLDKIYIGINQLDEKLTHCLNELNKYEDKLNAAQENFNLLGGLNSKQQVKLKNAISKLENEKKFFENRYNELLEFLPFIMLQPQISEIINIVKQENTSKNLLVVNEYINSPDLLYYLSNSLDKLTLDTLLAKISDYSSMHTTKNMLYDFTTKEEEDLISLWTMIEPWSFKDLENCINEINDLNIKIRNTNKKLDDATNEELKEHMSNITQFSHQIGQAEQEIETIKSTQVELKNQKLLLEIDLDKVRQQIKVTRKEGNISSIIDKVDTIVSEYCQKTKFHKQKAFEVIISNMFTSLIRKDDFIKEIKVNETTGEIMLFNKLGGRLPKENLSAGEKQIYILSILFGIISLSQNKVPLVFDTLLGRLDHTHKTHIVESFIKNCGEQVIILATDTEIDDQYLELLRPIMNNYYQIDYDSINNTVSHEQITLN
jgi:DNA sulfur modification protein DndD